MDADYRLSLSTGANFGFIEMKDRMKKTIRTLASATFVSVLTALAFPGCNGSKEADTAEEPSAAVPQMPWVDPSYKTDIPATMAESRPGAKEDPKSWTEWMRHHEDRKRWCTEKDVDLLMIGDSIVFGWSRLGKPVWDAYYGDRKSVNIGSSGDQTQHMLWHFQNGGLDGMKDHNPKLVVMMMGTNNRGEPELHGEDTAYGILALLKEIHTKLPESKILLMPIFPRGDTPEDAGRVRNAEINEILKTYVDNKTVHWLDLSHVFLDKEGKLNRDLMPDGLHPNLDGYWAWADAMESTISKFLGDPIKDIEKPLTLKPVPQPEKLGKHDIPNPDFTKGDPLPEAAVKDWTLGATGARGWMYIYQGTKLARQIYVTEVADKSPSAGLLAKGDVLLGVNGIPFSKDTREELGKALTAAEAEAGKLSLIRWRAGEINNITVELPVLGQYSPTAPYECAKSKLILTQSSEALAKRMQQPDYKEGAISRSLNALGLLACGDPKYLPLIKREAEWAADQKIDSMASWYYGYITIFLSEYVLATGDKSVLPGLRRIAMEASKGQSGVGSWGHRFAQPDGRLFGYGMMNSPGIPLTIGLVLAREAGVDDPEVAVAIQRSANLLRFFVGKGSVPYGDHAAFMQGHEDNGKNGMAAVLFDQLGEKEGTEFFAKMSTASHGNERDQGHTGNFFNMTWAMPGLSRGGPQATGAWMEEFGAWYFDLARSWDGSFRHQGPAQLSPDSYGAWDATGAYLIAYAMPLKAIRLTGSKPSSMPPLDAETARQVVLDGRGFDSYGLFTAYDGLPPDTLIELLGSWSPIVRSRASLSIGRQRDMAIEPLILMLDSPSVDARLGACEALAAFRNRSAPAVPKLQEFLRSDDLWLRIKAAEALNAIGPAAMVAVPEMLRMATGKPTAEDPRGMEQRYLIKSLFSTRDGLLGKSLEGVDRELLYEVVREGLKNEDGHARGALSSVYANLSLEELRPLMPVIHQAILDRSPSGEMFDGQIQTAGLDLFSKHHVSEGIELLVEYMRTMKKHSSQTHILTLLDMLKRYGAHAQRAIPQLEKTAAYFENGEEDFPKWASIVKAEAVRKTIKEIEAMTEKPELIELKGL